MDATPHGGKRRAGLHPPGAIIPGPHHQYGKQRRQIVTSSDEDDDSDADDGSEVHEDHAEDLRVEKMQMFVEDYHDIDGNADSHSPAHDLLYDMAGTKMPQMVIGAQSGRVDNEVLAIVANHVLARKVVPVACDLRAPESAIKRKDQVMEWMSQYMSDKWSDGRTGFAKTFGARDTNPKSKPITYAIWGRMEGFLQKDHTDAVAKIEAADSTVTSTFLHAFLPHYAFKTSRADCTAPKTPTAWKTPAHYRPWEVLELVQAAAVEQGGDTIVYCPVLGLMPVATCVDTDDQEEWTLDKRTRPRLSAKKAVSLDAVFVKIFLEAVCKLLEETPSIAQFRILCRSDGAWLGAATRRGFYAASSNLKSAASRDIFSQKVSFSEINSGEDGWEDELVHSVAEDFGTGPNPRHLLYVTEMPTNAHIGSNFIQGRLTTPLEGRLRAAIKQDPSAFAVSRGPETLVSNALWHNPFFWNQDDLFAWKNVLWTGENSRQELVVQVQAPKKPKPRAPAADTDAVLKSSPAAAAQPLVVCTRPTAPAPEPAAEVGNSGPLHGYSGFEALLKANLCNPENAFDLDKMSVAEVKAIVLVMQRSGFIYDMNDLTRLTADLNKCRDAFNNLVDVRAAEIEASKRLWKQDLANGYSVRSITDKRHFTPRFELHASHAKRFFARATAESASMNWCITRMQKDDHQHGPPRGVVAICRACGARGPQPELDIARSALRCTRPGCGTMTLNQGSWDDANTWPAVYYKVSLGELNGDGKHAFANSNGAVFNNSADALFLTATDAADFIGHGTGLDYVTSISEHCLDVHTVADGEKYNYVVLSGGAGSSTLRDLIADAEAIRRANSMGGHSLRFGSQPVPECWLVIDKAGFADEEDRPPSLQHAAPGGSVKALKPAASEETIPDD